VAAPRRDQKKKVRDRRGQNLSDIGASEKKADDAADFHRGIATIDRPRLQQRVGCA